jgi:hypothetical protein
MGQVPIWHFREPTQPSGLRSVIDRAESLIHLSDACLFSALRAKGLCLERRSEAQWRKKLFSGPCQPRCRIFSTTRPINGDDTLCQFQGHPVDFERLQFRMGQAAIEARTRRAYRSGPDPIRAAAYSRRHPSRERLRRAHNRRRPRPAHHRNGAALRQGGGSQGQDARSCEKL